MVESFIQEQFGEYKKWALWENLPRKVMYQTYSVIISYLQDSGRIAADSEGKICWIYNPGLVQRYINSTKKKDPMNILGTNTCEKNYILLQGEYHY